MSLKNRDNHNHGGLPGIAGGGRTAGSLCKDVGPYQAGLYHPAAALPGCGGAGQPQSVQGPARSAGRCVGQAAAHGSRGRCG